MTPLASGKHLGNRRRTFDPNRLHFSRFVNRSTINVPSVPLDVSVSPIVVANPWIVNGMFCNGPDPATVPVLMAAPFNLDQATAQSVAQGLGDCWRAAAVRRAALAAATVGKLLWTSYADALKACLISYMETGWNPRNSAATDQGTDPTEGDASMIKTGLLCSDGTYDKIGATLAVNPKDLEEVYIAFNLAAGNATIGVNFPSAWESGSTWDQTNSPIVGGHEICATSNLLVTPRGIKIRSWGEEKDITEAGLAQMGQDVTINIGVDQLGPGKINISGFDNDALIAALKAQGAS
jgi:hypothetical protein